MKWLALTITADLFATSMVRLSKGFRDPVYTALALLGYVAVFLSFAKAVEKLPLGAAYATWSGLGTAGVAIVGIAAFQDRIRPTSILGIALVITGIIVMNLTGIRTENDTTNPKPPTENSAHSASSTASSSSPPNDKRT